LGWRAEVKDYHLDASHFESLERAMPVSLSLVAGFKFGIVSWARGGDVEI
jgi:hypothetical protein